MDEWVQKFNHASNIETTTSESESFGIFPTNLTYTKGVDVKKMMQTEAQPASNEGLQRTWPE